MLEPRLRYRSTTDKKTEGEKDFYFAHPLLKVILIISKTIYYVALGTLSPIMN